MRHKRQYIPLESSDPWWKHGSDDDLRRRLREMSHQEAADLQATIKATITNIQAQLSDPTIADGIWRTRAARAKSYCIRRMSVVKQHLAATAHERREARQKRVEEGRAQHEYKLAELQRLRDLAAEGSTQEALVGLLDFMLRQRKTRAEKKS